MTFRVLFCWVAVVPMLGTSISYGAEVVVDDRVAFFETHVRPVLVEHCYECHSEASGESKGGLRLDSKQGILTGGDSGPALLPGKPDDSLLIRAMEYRDLEMPPDQKLPEHVIESFRKWTRDGAVDSRGDESPSDSYGLTKLKADRVAKSREKDAEFWSFRPVRLPQVPVVTQTKWSTNDIDRFVLAKQEENALHPSPDAPPEALVRRVYIDLLGLPPTIEQQDAFVNSTDPQRFEVLVDDVLHSPHFGERWGRHWLDLVRFAESSGGGSSEVMPDAWKYRDYVIASFNRNMPFDDFVREQIAGDLLPAANHEERAYQLIATGLLELGVRSYITDDATIFHMDGIDEQVTLIGHAFLGLTLDCARCHDHKFDPVSTEDYYALAGIFGNTYSAQEIFGTKNYTWASTSDPREDQDGSRLAAYTVKANEVAKLTSTIAKLQRELASAEKAKDASVQDQESTNYSETVDKDELAKLSELLAKKKAELPPKPATIMAVRDNESLSNINIRIRGNPHRLGKAVERGFVKVVCTHMPSGSVPSIPATQSGRLELANWLVSPDNPLTARVFVNRVWQHLHGRGLVATPNNFGTTGTLPSNPELLDYLAHTFVSEGWSIKELIRDIVLSRTYRQAATSPSVDVDPENAFLATRTRRRLDAETLRDSILLASGELDYRQGGPSFPASMKREYEYRFDGKCRSVFLPRFRNHSYELFQTFDGANPAMVVGKRDETILPAQSLYLINNEFVVEQSYIAATRLLAEDAPSDEMRIEKMFRRTLTRRPSEVEKSLAKEFLNDEAGDVTPQNQVSAWAALQQTLFQCVDFQFFE